jgi:hypothetical protein
MSNKRNPIVDLALSMYADEPCRICGENIAPEQIKSDGVVFAGYSKDSKSRSAHKACWDSRPDDVSKWANP